MLGGGITVADKRLDASDGRFTPRKSLAISRTTIVPMSEPLPTSVDFAPTRGNRGVTLIELIIVVVVVGVLAAIALPSFTSQIRAGRRLDAMTTLAQIQQAQERWRANCPCYSASLTAANTGCPSVDCASTSGLGLSLSSTRYRFEMPVSPTLAAPNSYTLTATGQGSQASDRASATSCATLSITVTNGVAIHAPGACWKQ